MNYGPRFSRLASFAMASGTGAVLGVAAWLQPAAAGHGTHTQLPLLGPCSFLSLTGLPCPMCGMTTTFTLMAHLRPLDALLTQPFGIVLFAATVLLFSVGVAETLAPARRWTRLAVALGPHEGKLLGLFGAGLIAGWFYKIAVMGIQ